MYNLKIRTGVAVAKANKSSRNPKSARIRTGVAVAKAIMGYSVEKFDKK